MPRLAFAILFAATLCVPATGAAANDAPVIEFGSPALVSGSLDALGLEWALLVFGSGDSLMDFDFDSVSRQVDHTFLSRESEGIDPVLAPGRNVAPVAEHTETPNRPASGTATLAPGFTSLLVEASRIDLRVNGSASLQIPGNGSEMAWFLPEASVPSDAYRDSPPVRPESVAIGIEPQGHITLVAEGVSRVEWFGATLTCDTDYCPPGGGRTQLADAPRTKVVLLSYVEVLSDGGSLRIAGSSVALAAGGKALDFHGDGYFRLPRAEFQGACGAQSCPNPEGRTLRLNGSMSFSSLRQADDRNRLTANAEGEVLAASIDEETIVPFSTKGTALTAAAVVTLALLAKALATLFTRHQRPALDNARTNQVYELICGQPGLSFSDLRKQAATGTGNLLRHLNRLLDEGHIVRRDYRNSHRYYQNHGRYDDDWRQVAALTDPDGRMLYDWLVARPDSTQTQVMAGVRRRRTTVHDALKRLKAAGLVTEQREGLFVHYRAVPLDSTKAS